MADNRELNPGQRHYQDLSNRRNGALAVVDKDNDASQTDYSDYNNYSSPTDYSEPKSQFGQQYKNNAQFTSDNTSGSKYNDYPTSDYNKSSRDYLNQGEQASLSYSSNKNMDLSRRENDASHQTSGFDSGNISKQKGPRVGNFKKRLIFGGLIATLSGGIIGAAMFVISGPMEIIQFAEYIKDFHTNITTAQSAARSFSASRSIARMMDSGSISEAVRNSRVGTMGRYMSDKMTQRLKNNGLELKSNWAGAAEGMDIDVNKMLGKDTLDPGDIDKVIKDLELPDGKYSVSGSILSIDGDIGYSNVRRILNDVGDVGKWDIVGHLRTRSTMKSLGYVSVWHPLQKAKNKAYKTATDLLKDFADGINRTDDTPSRARDGAEDEANDRNQAIDDGDIDGEKVDVDASGDTASDAIREIQASDDNVGRGVKKNISNTDGIDLKIAGSAALGLASVIVGALCIIKGVVETMGPQKQANVVNPGMGYVSTFLGLGSQVQNGSEEGDIDADTLGKVKKAFFYDKVPILDENGNDTGQKEPNSVYSGRVCEDLGITNCASTDNDPLTETVDLVYQVGSAGLPSIVRDVFNMVNAVNQSVGGPVIDFVCSAMDVIGTVTGSVGDFIQDMIMNFISTTDLAINAMTAFMNIVNGGGLPEEPIPSQISIIVSSAAGWMADEVGRTTNGAGSLNKVQSTELQLENRRYLAWKNSQKPLLARLFDPSDYNSSISQIAKIAKINSSDRSLSTQISNVFKVFASAPSIIATAGNQLVGGSAYAASYQDDRPVYAWSVEDMNEFTSASTSDSQYDMVKNTDYVINLLEKEGTPNADDYNDDTLRSSKPLHYYAYKCLGVTIAGSPDYTVSINDNSDGEWNYPDNLANPFCSGDQRPNGYKELGLYVMDYNNTVAGACYEGGEDDGEADSACREMGVWASGSGSIDTAGNQPANEMQKAFADETGGVYGAYSTDYNGCTTVSAWFIGAHTTLVYGHGNGNQVVDNLIANNPGKLTATDKPTKAPAIFSSWKGTLHASGSAGHTGLVTAVNEDGTIETLESGANDYMNGFSYPYSRTFTLSPEEYSGDVKFVYVGDYLK